MTSNTLFAAAFASLALTGSIVQAGGAGESLPKCYEHVLNACNENSNYPEACAESGMNACDELHAAHATVPGMQIQLFQNPGTPPTYRFVLVAPEPAESRPTRSTTDAGSNDDPRDPTGRPVPTPRPIPGTAASR